MGITRKPTKLNGSMPVFWRGECKVLPKDFELTTLVPDGAVLYKGTPVYIDYATGNHQLCATAKIVSGGTTSAPRVAKGHSFAAGMNVFVGETAGQIVSIDTSNAEYDVFTLKAAVTGATSGAILTSVSTAVVPNTVIAETKEMDTTRGFKGVAVSYDAVVLLGSIPPLPEAWVTGYCLKNNHSIKFIKQ